MAPRFRWADLIGRRVILLAEAPTPWMCLQDVLRRQGVDARRITFLHGLPVPRALEAFRAGEADYLQTAQPVAEELIEEGAAHLAAALGEAVGHIPYTSFVVTPELRQPKRISASGPCGRWREPNGGWRPTTPGPSPT